MQRVVRLLLIAGGIGAFAGCEGLGELVESYEQVTLEPVAVGTRDDMIYEAGGGPWCPVRTRGLASAIPVPDAEAGEVLLGYDGFDDRGTPPLRCPERAVHQFDGAVRFDLGSLPPTAASPLMVATLTARRRATPVPSNPGCETVLAGIERATAAWEPGLAPGDFTTEAGPAMRCEEGPRGRLSCNLNTLARRWIARETPNAGVVLRSIRYRPGGEIYFPDPTCAFYYDRFRLDVRFPGAGG